MKILATGDHHFKAGPRWAECLRVHHWIRDEVHARQPDLFVSCGDVYDSTSTPEERAEVASFLVGVAAVCPVLVVRGNHDRARDLELLAGLTSRCPIIVEEGAGVHLFDGLAVAAFAWPSRASIASALGASSSEEVGQLGRESLRRVFRGLGDRLRLERADGLGTLLVGHAHVAAARVTELGQPLPFGEQIVVGLEDLELAGADAVLLGHIHLAQLWEREGGPILYTGSPFRNTFGEADPKSITQIELHPSPIEDVRVTRIPTPASPMILVDTAAALEQLVAMHPDELATAEVRIRYDVAPDQRVAARADMLRTTAKLEGLVARLKVEERVRPVTRARAPEVAAAFGLAAQLLAYWNTRPELDLEGRIDSLRRKIGELEDEVTS